MLIWINGTYGVGKTTVAEVLKNKLSSYQLVEIMDSDYYNAEMIEHNPALAFGGISPQDNPHFISYFRNLIDKTIANTKSILIVTMSLTCQISKTGLYDYYSNRGIPFFHFILSADEATIRSRIINDKNRDKEFALTNLTSSCTFLHSNFPENVFVDTTGKTPSDIAEEIVNSIKPLTQMNMINRLSVHIADGIERG